MRVVVTGGGGYVGYHVGWALFRAGHHVTLFDLTPPDPEWTNTAPRALWDALPGDWWQEKQQNPGSLEFVKGSVTSLKDLECHFEGATAVVHCASYGMSGKEQLAPHAPQQEKVNVEGTKQVIQAALTSKVRALVYTSTYNVVFGGREIAGGDESMPLYPLHAHTDHYSRTKSIAEMLVLMADGKCGPPTPPQPAHPPPGHPPASPQSALPPTSPPAHPSTPPPCLRTCALRMNGVMGLGEKKHTHRVMDAIRSGLLILAYGRKEGLVDFIGIQNVVQAHVKALMTLLKEQNLNTQDLPSSLPNPCKIKIKSYGRKQNSAVNSDSPLPVASHISSSKLTQMDSSCANETGCELRSRAGPCEFRSISSSSCAGPSEFRSFSSSSSSSVPCFISGQAFFISDGAPVSHFEYFRPLFEGLGYSFPAVTLPLWVILFVAYLQAFIYCLVYKYVPFTPFVTPAEAYKSGVTHYCSCRKAMDRFSYCPTRPNDLKQVVEYYKAQGCTKTH